MTREETQKILSLIQTAYPNYKVENKTATINLWTTLFGQYSEGVVEKAVENYMLQDLSGYAPSIGQVNEQIRLLNHGEFMSSYDAWDLVKKAMCNSAYHSQEEFDALPEIIQKTVGSADVLRGWALEEENRSSFLENNFLRAYDAVCKREESHQKMTPEIRQTVEKSSLFENRAKFELTYDDDDDG